METLEQVKSVALFYKEGNSDKEYNVWIEKSGNGYVVNFSYGRRGNATNTGTKTESPVDLASAEKAYNKLVAEKTAKGYVADGEGKPFSGIDTSGESTGLMPQLLNPITEEEAGKYIDDPLWVCQEKFDGKRIMIKVEHGKVTASNRRGLSVGIPSEIETVLKNAGDVVLDGELIGSKYYMFDQLRGRNGDMSDWPYINRLRELDELYMMLVPSFGDFALQSPLCAVKSAFSTENKKALYQSLKDKEGVVFKNLSSRYAPGRPNSGGPQMKCKFWSSCSALVTQKKDNKRSVSIALLNSDGNLVDVGNVTIPANYEIPDKGAIVEIKYLYALVNLVQPQYLGERDDKTAPDDISSLKFKSKDNDDDN